MLALTGTVSLGVAAFVVYSAVRYRRRGRELPPQVPGSTLIELGWALIPLGLFMIPFIWGASIYLDMYRPVPGSLEITGYGKQWMWKFEHPGGQREIDELHLPVGRPVTLRLSSEDVIHSFFVPAFRVKQDVLPGRYTTVSFEPTREGRFHLFCSEYCGTAHSGMRGWVTVMSDADYERWLTLGASRSPASEGAKLYQQFGCVLCHREDSLHRAPALSGLYGRPVQLSTGQTVIADESYLRESIMDPGAKVAQGYQPIMPSFRGQLSEEQLGQLIAFIRSLGPGRAGPGEPPPEPFAPANEPLFPLGAAPRAVPR
jgi:cytochrome c oxidase subunit 2